jgi:hypothetical protein
MIKKEKTPKKPLSEKAALKKAAKKLELDAFLAATDEKLLNELQKLGLFATKEVRFAKASVNRGWRSDYFIERKGKTIAIEQEGGLFSGGRHTRGAGYAEDMQKYNYYTAHNIMLLRFTPSQIAKHTALIAKACEMLLLGQDCYDILFEIYREQNEATKERRRKKAVAKKLIG